MSCAPLHARVLSHVLPEEDQEHLDMFWGGGGCNFRSFAVLLIPHSVFILVPFSGESPGLAMAMLLNVTG